MTLQEFFQTHPRAALAFSGGADSAYLLWAGRTWGEDVRPYYVSTPFQPAWELADARRLASELGAPLTVVELDVLACPQVAANPENRCYHCKQALFSALWQRVRADGYSLLLDGTNASDDAADRPGMKALRELEVRSPLRACGVTKAQVRALSRQAGQARLCLSGHPHSHRHPHCRCGSGPGGEKRGRPLCPGLYQLPHPSAGGHRGDPAAPVPDGPSGGPVPGHFGRSDPPLFPCDPGLAATAEGGIPWTINRMC